MLKLTVDGFGGWADELPNELFSQRSGIILSKSAIEFTVLKVNQASLYSVAKK